MVTDVNITAARALCAAATPGEWIIVEVTDDEYADDKKWRRINSEDDTSMEASICEVGDWNHDGDADARFICAARTGWPAALDEIERLRALLTEACECLPGANEGNRFHAERIRKAAGL